MNKEQLERIIKGHYISNDAELTLHYSDENYIIYSIDKSRNLIRFAHITYNQIKLVSEWASIIAVISLDENNSPIKSVINGKDGNIRLYHVPEKKIINKVTYDLHEQETIILTEDIVIYIYKATRDNRYYSITEIYNNGKETTRTVEIVK